MSWIKSRRIDLWPYTRGTPQAPVQPETRLISGRQEYPLLHPLPKLFGQVPPVPPANLTGRSISLRQEYPLGHPLPRFWTHALSPFAVAPGARSITVRQEYPLAAMTRKAMFDWAKPSNPTSFANFGGTVFTKQEFPKDQYARPMMLLETLYGPDSLAAGIFVQQEYPAQARTMPPVMGGPPTATTGAWTTVFTGTLTSEAASAGYVGFTEANILPLAQFSSTGGTKMRITMKGPPSGDDTQMDAMYIGNGGAAEVYGFGSAPVQVTVSGSTTINLPITTSVLSDELVFVKDGVNSFVWSGQLSNAAADGLLRYTPDVSGGAYFKAGTDAATQNKTGYSADTAGMYVVTKIEIFYP